MKRIAISESDEPITRADLYVVEVDWFPRLTEQQLLENSVARMNGQPAPHENPNLIDVVVTRSMARLAALLKPDSTEV